MDAINRNSEAIELEETLAKHLGHYDVLNVMLAENCPLTRDGDEVTFEFVLCCRTARITAELISTVDTIQYKILEFEII